MYSGSKATVRDLYLTLGGYAHVEGYSTIVADTLFMGDTGQWSGSPHRLDENKLDLNYSTVTFSSSGTSYIGKDAQATVNSVNSNITFDGFGDIVIGSGATGTVTLTYTSNFLAENSTVRLGENGGKGVLNVSADPSDELFIASQVILGDGSYGSSAEFNVPTGGYTLTVDYPITAPNISGTEYAINLGTSGTATMVMKNQSGRQPYINVAAAGIFVGYGTINAGMSISGKLTGDGTFGVADIGDNGRVVVNSGGNIDPGPVEGGGASTHGTLEFVSDLYLDGSTTTIDISGPASDPTAYDKIVVEGNLHMGGNLVINFTGEYDTPYFIVESRNRLADGGFEQVLVYDNNVGGYRPGELGQNYNLYRFVEPYPSSLALIVFDPVKNNEFVYWNGNPSNGPTKGGYGGTGTWANNIGNWVNDSGNHTGPWVNGDFAYFQGGSDGTVTVDANSNISFWGMNITRNYTFKGASLTLSDTNSETGDTIDTIGIYVDYNREAIFQSALIESASGMKINKTGAGTLTLASSSNNYTGGTTISDGTVKITGSINGDFSGAGDLIFDLSATETYIDDLYSGLTGNVTFTGENDYIINRTASGFSGNVTIDNAGVSLNGNRLTGDTITITNNGVLSGTGSVGNYSTGSVKLHSSATIRPGSSTGASGTMTIVSDNGLELSAGSTLVFNVGGTSQSTRLVVNGAISGTADIVVYVSGSNNSTRNQTYTLVTYGGGNYNLADRTVYSNGQKPFYGSWDIQSNYVNNSGQQTNTTVLTIYGYVEGDFYWNGSITTPVGHVVGGNGTWGGQRNWTDRTGQVPSYWTNGANAIFSAEAGTVQVNSGNRVGDMEFLVDGYVLEGATLSLSGGDVSGTSRIYAQTGTTIISNSLTTSSDYIDVIKAGGGELVLTAASNFWHGTVTIQQGQLTLGKSGYGDGSVTGDILGSGGTTLNINPTTGPYNFNNDITGYSGNVVIGGSSKVTFTGKNANFGGTTTLNGNSLAVTNALGGVVNINSGTLYGPGTIGSEGRTVYIKNSATLQAADTSTPGSTLAIGGSLDLGSSATARFLIDVTGEKGDLFNIHL